MLLTLEKLPSPTTSYRPISLISSIMKLFEMVIEQRLRSHLEKIGFLNKHQSGFRRAKSTEPKSTEPNLNLYGETLKGYPQVKFLGITFDAQLTFKKHFEDILDRCNTRYHRLRLLANKKWVPSPSTLIQIYKQCVRPIFEYGSLSTVTTSDYIICKIQWLQNKFIRFALRLPKYISPKLLQDSSGLPYVKDRLLSSASKSLDRIAQNPLVEESISSNRLNPAWDRFPTSLSVIRPVSLQFNTIYWGDLPNAYHYLKQVVRPVRDTFGTVLALYRIKANTDCPGSLILEVPQASLSDMTKRSLPPYFAHMVWVKFAHPTH